MSEHPQLLFQRQIVLPVVATLLGLLLVFLLAFESYLNSRVVMRAQQSLVQVENAWMRLRDESARRVAWFAAEAAQNPDLQSAMRRQDKSALIKHSAGRYADLYREFGISHWYFRAGNLVEETGNQVRNDASEGLDEASNNVDPATNRNN